MVTSVGPPTPTTIGYDSSSILPWSAIPSSSRYSILSLAGSTILATIIVGKRRRRNVDMFLIFIPLTQPAFSKQLVVREKSLTASNNSLLGGIRYRIQNIG